MADLKSLIRFKSHQLDQKKRALAALYKGRDSIAEEKRGYQEGLQKERKILEEQNDINAQVSYMRYADNVKKRIEDCEKRLEKMDRQILKAQDLMREAFAELKKIETIDERREQDALQAQRKKEDTEMDEIGIDQYMRQKKQEES